MPNCQFRLDGKSLQGKFRKTTRHCPALHLLAGQHPRDLAALLHSPPTVVTNERNRLIAKGCCAISVQSALGWGEVSGLPMCASLAARNFTNAAFFAQFRFDAWTHVLVVQLTYRGSISMQVLFGAHERNTRRRQLKMLGE